MSRETIGYLLGLVGVVISGATPPATRSAVPDLAPWFVTKGRAAVAGLPAVGLLFVMRRPLPPRDIWPDLVLGAAALVVGFPGLVALAIQTLPASQGGLVLAGRAASRLKPAA